MQILKTMIANPIANAIVAAHWLLFVFALFYERHLIFSEGITFHGPEPVLYNFLLLLNTPSASLMEFLIVPVLSLLKIEKNLLTESFVDLIFIIISSLQWLGLGHLTAAVVEIYKPKEVNLTLK